MELATKQKHFLKAKKCCVESISDNGSNQEGQRENYLVGFTLFFYKSVWFWTEEVIWYRKNTFSFTAKEMLDTKNT